jgi:hypothetical protein
MSCLRWLGALGPPGRLARRLDGGQGQACEDADDRDDHQQLEQREATPGPPPGRAATDAIIRTLLSHQDRARRIESAGDEVGRTMTW